MGTEADTIHDEKAEAAAAVAPDETGSLAAEAPGVDQQEPEAAESEPDTGLSPELPADEPAAGLEADACQLTAADPDEVAAAVEAVLPDVAVSAVAEPLDRSAEILEAVARCQAVQCAEQAAVQEKTEQALQELADLAGKVALLSTTMSAMTVTIQKLAEESEQLASWSGTVKGVGTLSKLFQVAAILVLVLLFGGISWLAVRQHQASHHLHQAEAGIAEAIKTQQKQIAEYDKHFAELVGAEIKKEREVSSKASVQEKINRLRNGLAEQQLYRKSNGDWFVVNGKNEAALSDPALIEELNQAFVAAGRALTTTYLVPPHKVVVMLRPNGKGGTEILVTKEVVP